MEQLIQMIRQYNSISNRKEIALSESDRYGDGDGGDRVGNGYGVGFNGDHFGDGYAYDLTSGCGECGDLDGNGQSNESEPMGRLVEMIRKNGGVVPIMGFSVNERWTR